MGRNRRDALGTDALGTDATQRNQTRTPHTQREPTQRHSTLRKATRRNGRNTRTQNQKTPLTDTERNTTQHTQPTRHTQLKQLGAIRDAPRQDMGDDATNATELNATDTTLEHPTRPQQTLTDARPGVLRAYATLWSPMTLGDLGLDAIAEYADDLGLCIALRSLQFQASSGPVPSSLPVM